MNAFNNCLSLFTLFSRDLLEVLFNLEGGNEVHGVRHRMWVTEKQVQEMWVEHGVVLSNFSFVSYLILVIEPWPM
jgi:hypothetical protein